MKKFVVIAMLAVIASPATAAPYATFPTAGASNAASNLGITITALGGLLNVPISPTALTGTADAAISLDGTDSGSVQVFSGSFNLADVVGSAVTVLGTINYSLVGVGFDLSMGPVTATNGAFVIDSSTAGGLNLNQGVINLSGAVTTALNLVSSPINAPFSGLGATTIAGTTDDDLTGNDTTASGDEINIAWPTGVFASIPITTPINTTLNIFLTGSGLSIGSTVPEPTSGLFLASLAAGACGVIRRRRS